MANQDDFEKLVADMHNAETINEAMNTLLTGLSTMLENDAKAAKAAQPFPATDQQLQSLSDTMVNLTAHSSDIIGGVVGFVIDTVPGEFGLGEIDPVARQQAIADHLASQPRSAAHAAVQGARGAPVMPPAPLPATPLAEQHELDLDEATRVQNPAETRDDI